MKQFRTLFAGFVLCLFFLENCSSVIQGEIIAKGKFTGDFILAPTGCFSGARMQFHGIILSQKENGGVILTGIIDPIRGKIIKLRLPNSCRSEDYDDCDEIFISKESCSMYKIKIESTNVIINRVRALRGKLELDCRFEEGGSIKGKIEFDYCH